MMSVSVDAFVAGPRGHVCHGVGDLRGDWGAPANLHRRLRRPERVPKVVFSKTLANATWADPRSHEAISQTRSPLSATNPAGDHRLGRRQPRTVAFEGRNRRRVRSLHTARSVRERPPNVPGPARPGGWCGGRWLRSEPRSWRCASTDEAR